MIVILRNALLASACMAVMVLAASAPALSADPPPADAAGQPAAPAPPMVSVGDPNSTGVASIVNDYLISEYDVSQRVALVLVTAGIQNPTPEVLAQLRQQALTSLQDETLQLQEAVEQEISINNADIENAIRSVADDNGVTLEAITNTLGQAGVSMSTFRRQLAAQLAWTRLIEARYGGTITIDDAAVDAALERLEEGADRPQFAVAEIFLSVDAPADEEAVRESAVQIMQQLNQGAVFANLARQFSQAASAARGGDIGWVIEDQLPEELNTTLADMEPGRIAGPIRSEGGYYILMLMDRREPAGTEAVSAPVIDPDAPVPIDRLLLPLPPNATDEARTQAMEFAVQAYTNIQSCEELPELVAQVPGAVHMRLGELNLNQLAPQISELIRSTPPGEVVPPFNSMVGVEIFVRCDQRVREAIPFVIPTRDEMRQQLFVQQMTVLARSYMRDLRRDAVIETR
jgi:peptidyl-prolyl cis-trans isomerase SurA